MTTKRCKVCGANTPVKVFDGLKHYMGLAHAAPCGALCCIGSAHPTELSRDPEKVHGPKTCPNGCTVVIPWNTPKKETP